MPKDQADEKLCPNCKKALDTAGENVFYCEPCDLTFELKKGRVKASAGGNPEDPAKKGKIQKLEEDLAYLSEENKKIKDYLFGPGEEPFWMR
jgi:hypothetical protein